MSFGKAEELVRLALLAGSRQLGVTLSEIAEEFGCTHRTAQRMTKALETAFPDVEIRIDDERRKRWRLRERRLGALINVSPAELSALSVAAEELSRVGDPSTASTIDTLRVKLLALMPAPDARRAEVDADALLEAQGFAARPGPRRVSRPEIEQAMADGITGLFQLRICYQGKKDEASRERIVAPYGLLLGPRRYLVAKALDDMHGPFRHFRVDRILSAETLAERFARDPDFDIHAHARRAFGTYQNDDELGEVVWHFDERSADHARTFEFHPDQIVEDQPDGSLIVRFRAAGWTEMAWHLYQWGDAVEVTAPEELREMVDGYRRSDFYPVFP